MVNYCENQRDCRRVLLLQVILLQPFGKGAVMMPLPIGGPHAPTHPHGTFPQYFGEQADPALCNNHCDNCELARTFEEVDVTDHAKNIIATGSLPLPLPLPLPETQGKWTGKA